MYILKIIKGLNITFVHANMPRLSFDPYNFFFFEIRPCKIFYLLKKSLGPLKLQGGTHMLTWRMLTVHKCYFNATSASECHLATSMSPGTFLKDRKFCKDGFQKKNLQGPKLKRDIFAGTSQIFKP